jgi:hypothetical protein
LIQPFFGAVSPTLLIPGLSLKFPYLVFGCAELSRHFVSRFYGLPVFFLSSTGGTVKGAQNSLPSPVKRSPVSALAFDLGAKGTIASAKAAPRLLIASHSSIQNTEANFQHPVGPKTIRPPVDNSLLLLVWLASHPG